MIHRLGARPIITFDLDSTLCDTRHRHDLIKDDGSTDWVAYSLACIGDKPIQPAVAMFKALALTNDIWIVSGRSHAAYDLTVEWLHRYSIMPAGIVLQTEWAAKMWPDHNQYKLAMIDKIENMTSQMVRFHVDDWPPVVKHLLDHGRDAICISSPQHLATFAPQGKATYV